MIKYLKDAKMRLLIIKIGKFEFAFSVERL